MYFTGDNSYCRSLAAACQIKCLMKARRSSHCHFDAASMASRRKQLLSNMNLNRHMLTTSVSGCLVGLDSCLTADSGTGSDRHAFFPLSVDCNTILTVRYMQGMLQRCTAQLLRDLAHDICHRSVCTFYAPYAGEVRVNNNPICTSIASRTLQVNTSIF